MKYANKIILIVCILILFGALYFSSTSKTFYSVIKSNSLQVTTSFYPLYYFASVIGGDKADVKNITPSGSEPHDYEPTAKDIARLETSDIVIVNGGVEAWSSKVKENLQNTNVLFVVAGEGLLSQALVENGNTIKDPHIWLDPQLANREIVNILHAFVEKDPANRAYYEANAKILDQKMDELDAQYKKGLRTCQNRDIFTSHAAFGYLASGYGLKQIAIAGISPDAEPSVQQLADVAKLAKQNNAHYIFFESLISPKLSQTIAHEIGAKTLVLDPLEGLSQDQINQGENYFTVMEENLKNLQIALQCTN